MYKKILKDYIFILEFEKFNLDFKNDVTTKFDIEYYKEKYDLKNENPIIHYLKTGFKEGCNPNPYFDTEFYLNEYPDVETTKLNPFIHYLKFGINEGKIAKISTLNELKKQNLKYTVKGRNNYLFLINDTNQEFDQHFNDEYENHFKTEKFKQEYDYKKQVFNELKIDYNYYVVPDKSIVCKKFLPFNPESMKRNIDAIDEINDFSEYLDPTDYFRCDTHTNYAGGKKLTFKILNHLDGTIDWDSYEQIIYQYGNGIEQEKYCDLLSDINWSFSTSEKQGYENPIKIKYEKPKNLKESFDAIPERLKLDKNRKSEYYINPDSISTKRVCIFHDSSINFLKWYLSFYFREIFLYWDHGHLNRELIKWFKPDLILEIRIERFLENIPVPPWVLNKEGI